MDLLIVLVVVLVVVALVIGPLRARGRADQGADREGAGAAAAELADLEAAKEAKYREIRDAELDFRTGKLSDEDWHALDGSLRAEAVELLRALDRLRDRGEPVG